MINSCMYRILTVSTLAISPIIASAQDYQKKFEELISAKDTAGEFKLLKEWEFAKPKDPEMFVSWYNYYVNKSVKEIVSIESKPSGEEFLQVTDTGSGKTVGYINSHITYVEADLQKAFSYINRGIALFPDRLDMRFGKIYMLGESGDFNAFTDETIAAINYDLKIKNKWKWSKNKTVEDPKKFFLDGIQGYVETLYNTGDEKLLPLMRRISEAVLEHYRDNVENLSNVAITYILTDDYDKGLPFLLRAEKIDPKDVIVLNNIAEIYSRKKDNAKATSYYNRIIKIGNEEDVEDAKQKLRLLK